MSYYNPDALKGALDPTIPYKPFRQPFTTAQVRIETLLQFNLLYKRCVIQNNDAANNLTFRKEPSGDLITLPPASQAEVLEWGSFIEINPNAATGTGLVEFDLVDQKAAQR